MSQDAPEVMLVSNSLTVSTDLTDVTQVSDTFIRRLYWCDMLELDMVIYWITILNGVFS